MMKPIWKHNELTVHMHKPDLDILKKALDIGRALVAMNQATGQPLVDAILDITGDQHRREQEAKDN